MDNSPKSRDQQLDDQLSEFTDRVLSTDKNEVILQKAMNQDELAELQKNVLSLKGAVQTARTGEVTNARIRTRLLDEWKKTRQADHQAPKHFVWNRSLQRIAVIGGLAVLIILGVIKLFIPSGPSLIGTADALQSWSPLLILAGIIVIVFLLWHNRHN